MGYPAYLRNRDIAGYEIISLYFSGYPYVSALSRTPAKLACQATASWRVWCIFDLQLSPQTQAQACNVTRRLQLQDTIKVSGVTVVGA